MDLSDPKASFVANGTNLHACTKPITLSATHPQYPHNMSPPTPVSQGLHGVWVDALMPLTSDQRVDLVHLTSHLRTLGAKGASQFLLFGCGGEGPSFSGQEKLATLRHLLAAGFSAEQFMLGVSYSAVSETIALAHAAHDLGVRRFLVPPPLHVSRPQQAGVVRYFDALMQGLHRPDVHLHLHLLDSGSAGDLSDAVIADLLRTCPGQLAGLVDQGGVAPRTQDRLRNFGSQLGVCIAHEGNWTLVHTSGMVSALANLVPHLVQGLLSSLDPAQATKIVGLKERRPDDRIQELLRVIGDRPLVPTLKLLLSLMYRNADWLRVRPPHATLDPVSQESLMKAFKTFNLQPNE